MMSEGLGVIRKTIVFLKQIVFSCFELRIFLSGYNIIMYLYLDKYFLCQFFLH